jgi:hypothetical protein
VRAEAVKEVTRVVVVKVVAMVAAATGVGLAEAMAEVARGAG